MRPTLGCYEIIVRPVNGRHHECIIGNVTLASRNVGVDTVEFYDVNRELDSLLTELLAERVTEIPSGIEE